MLDGNNERRTVDESYATAVSGSSLRVGNDHTIRTPGDIVAAAGLNQYRMGMALMRLVSEWNSGAVPKVRDLPDVKEHARTVAARRVEEDIDHATMKVSEKRALRSAVTVQKADMEVARAELVQLEAQATNWQIEEHKLRFQRLKTLPTVRAALQHWVLEKGWVEEGAAGIDQLVADTLRHFLAPKCSHCKGRGQMVLGTSNRAVGRECRKCRGTGEADLQHGGRGRALLGYLRQCTGQAAKDLREGAHRLRRSPKEEEDRQERKKHQRIEELRRADAQDRAAEGVDNAAVADKFKMGERRPVGGWRHKQEKP